MHCSELIMKSSHQSWWRDHTEDSLISSAPNFYAKQSKSEKQKQKYYKIKCP